MHAIRYADQSEEEGRLPGISQICTEEFQEVKKRAKIRKKTATKPKRAIIRMNEKHVSVLCPLGHLLESHKLDRSFGGSSLEAELAFRHEGDRFDRLAAACRGAGHEVEKKERKVQRMKFLGSVWKSQDYGKTWRRLKVKGKQTTLERMIYG
jgi:hypothetical protein